MYANKELGCLVVELIRRAGDAFAFNDVRKNLARELGSVVSGAEDVKALASRYVTLRHGYPNLTIRRCEGNEVSCLKHPNLLSHKDAISFGTVLLNIYNDIFEVTYCKTPPTVPGDSSGTHHGSLCLLRFFASGMHSTRTQMSLLYQHLPVDKKTVRWLRCDRRRSSRNVLKMLK